MKILIRKLIDKLFYLNAWTVGYRKIEDGITELPTTDNKAKYELIPLTDFKYYADPFIIEDNDDIYLFAESMNRFRGIASISVSKYVDGKFGSFQEIIKEPFHMSYPNVFKYNDEYYMIPETSDSGQVRLYKSSSFPYVWELSSVLLDNGNCYTDNSIEIVNNKVYLYTYFENDTIQLTEIYLLDMNSCSVFPINDYKCVVNERPAGNPCTIRNKSYRPVQDCEDCYGRAIKLYELNKNGEESYHSVINEDCYDIDIKRITGTHTFNRSEHFEVVDFKYNRFCLFKRVIWLVHFFRR